jgi:hypothetical protein
MELLPAKIFRRMGEDRFCGIYYVLHTPTENLPGFFKQVFSRSSCMIAPLFSPREFPCEACGASFLIGCRCLVCWFFDQLALLVRLIAWA